MSHSPFRRHFRDVLALHTLDPAGSQGPLGPLPTTQARAPLVQHERKEQEALVAWVQHQPWADRFFHWPNERRSRTEALALTRQGVRKGAPDNWLFLPRGGYCGAVSELKRRGAPPSAVSADQRAAMGFLEECGFLVGVHRGWDEAREFFEGYVAL